MATSAHQLAMRAFTVIKRDGQTKDRQKVRELDADLHRAHVRLRNADSLGERLLAQPALVTGARDAARKLGMGDRRECQARERERDQGPCAPHPWWQFGRTAAATVLITMIVRNSGLITIPQTAMK